MKEIVFSWLKTVLPNGLFNTKIMEIHLSHEQIKEYLTIIDQEIKVSKKMSREAERSKKEYLAGLREGEAIGYAMARDILFCLDQIVERKKEENTAVYETCNLPRMTLEAFIEEINQE